MQRLKRIVHRRRSSSNGDTSVVTLSVQRNELEALVDNVGMPPQKSGILLKYTNVVKRWKKRLFTLENGVLSYSTPHGVENDDSPDDVLPSRVHEKSITKKAKQKLLRRIPSKDDKERDVRGSIHLQSAVISPDDSDSCRFVIDCGHDLYHCKAENETERDEWVRALNGSNSYFNDLIARAVARTKEVPPITSNQPEIQPNNENSQAPVNIEEPDIQQNDSDESEESVLEDDGLREAEEDRKALITELRRILSLWRSTWIMNDIQMVNEDDLVNTLVRTFCDSATSNKSPKHITREAAQGLMDLAAWCLRELETNDEMFEKRLKDDLNRLMGRGLPVFPKSPGRFVSAPDHFILDDEDSDSDAEFVDALSRAASLRIIEKNDERWPTPAVLFEEKQLTPSRSTVTHEPQVQKSNELTRIGTKVLSPPVFQGGRTNLPQLSGPREALNVFSLIKDCVGKDLSKISFPVQLNEPMSFLQRLAEDIEYSELLDQAAAEPDPDRRLMYAATLVISHYSSTQGRIAKPFNPLLGETSCLINPQKGKGIRFISEQVSHHPPVSSCYAEGHEASWKYYNTIEVKNKFWGKSLEIFPTGLNHIEIPKYEDHYVFEQIATSVHNIVMGRMWLDNYGEMEIVNRTNGGKCVITFNKSGWMSDARSFASIKATVYDAKGKAKIKMGGNWIKSVYEDLGKGKRNVIWTAEERPPEGASQDYNYTKWAITLNSEVTEEETPLVAPTDSRLRPDQRALENGQCDLASRLKSALEEGQRERRRLMEEAGKTWEPLWFKKSVDKETGHIEYLFTDTFFRKQAERDWEECPDLFSCAANESE